MPQQPPGGGALAYNNKLIGVESGGNPLAQNPNSTATGPAQFTESTWLDNFNKTFPAQAAMPDAQKLALRTNPQSRHPGPEYLHAEQRAGADQGRYSDHGHDALCGAFLRRRRRDEGAQGRPECAAGQSRPARLDQGEPVPARG
jgi:hypothetical protein